MIQSKRKTLARFGALFMVAVMCLGMFTACSGTSGGSSTPAPASTSASSTDSQAPATDNAPAAKPFEGITVTVNLNQPADSIRDKYDEWIDHLKVRMKDELGVDLVVEMVSWGDYLNKHLMSIANGDGPDIIQMGSGVPSVIAAADGLLDLTPYMDTFGGIDNFFDVAQYYSTWEGKVIAIPWGGGGRVTYYNKKLYTEAGLDFPVNDWSYEKFLSDVDALTKHMGKPAYAVMGASNEATYNFWAQLVTDGGSILSENRDKAMFNSAEGVKSVRKILDLYDGGYTPASFAESTNDDLMAAFINGEVAISYGSASWWQDIMSVFSVDEFGIVTMPTGSTGKTTGAVTMSEYGVMKYTKNPDAVVAVLGIIAGTEETVTSTSILGWVPFRNDLVKDPAYSKYPFYETFFHNAQNSVLHIPQVANVSKILSASTKTLNDLYAEAVTGKTFTDEEIQARLDALAEEVNAML